MTDPLQKLAASLVDKLVNPLIALLFAIAFVVFAYGVIEFLWGLSQQTDGRENGKRHMLWGVVGMFVMVAGYAILVLIRNTVCGFAGGGGGPGCS